MISSRNVSPDDLAWKEGMSDWEPLRNVMTGLNSLAREFPVSRTGRVILEEPGIHISSDLIQIGSHCFVPATVGAVSLEVERRRLVFPLIGLILFGMMTLGGIADLFSSKEKGGPIILTFFILLPLTLWCGNRCFSPRKISLMLAASGGLQKSLTGTDRARMDRIAAAIQQAIPLRA